MSGIVRTVYGAAAILSTVGVMSVYASQTSAGQTPPRTPTQTSGKTPAQTSGKTPTQTSGKTSSQGGDKSSSQAGDKTSSQDKSSTSAQNQKPLTDAQFVMKASEGGKKEVALAKAALTKVSNDDVKAFAQRMVNDHSSANDELASLAKTKKIAVRASTPSASLPAAKGAAADKKYMEMMVKDHQEDVALFEAESQNAKDPELKAWVDKTLPTLRDHLKQAQDIYGKVSK